MSSRGAPRPLVDTAGNYLFLGAVVAALSAAPACGAHVIDPIGGGPSGGTAGSLPMNVAGFAGDAAGSGNLGGGGADGGTAGGGGMPAIQPPPHPDAAVCTEIAAATRAEAANNGVAAVGVRGGGVVFSAGEHWNGNGWDGGSLSTPGAWKVSDTGIGCSNQIAPTLGFIDLNAPKPATTAADAAATVMSTALVVGLSEYGTIVDGLVALYPGQPNAAPDYIVMLNAVAKP